MCSLTMIFLEFTSNSFTVFNMSGPRVNCTRGTSSMVSSGCFLKRIPKLNSEAESSQGALQLLMLLQVVKSSLETVRNHFCGWARKKSNFLWFTQNSGKILQTESSGNSTAHWEFNSIHSLQVRLTIQKLPFSGMLL